MVLPAFHFVIPPLPYNQHYPYPYHHPLLLLGRMALGLLTAAAAAASSAVLPGAKL